MAAKFRYRKMSNGDIQYIKNGVEPPPEIDGYIRDPRDYWLFHPGWVECRFRNQREVTKPCGAIRIKSTCSHQDGPKPETSYHQCAACVLLLVELEPT